MNNSSFHTATETAKPKQRVLVAVLDRPETDSFDSALAQLTESDVVCPDDASSLFLRNRR